MTQKTRIPHTYVLLFTMILVCSILSNIIPSGTYDRHTNSITGQTVVDAGSFRYIEQSTIGILDLFASFHSGMVESASLIFFILITGGSMMIIQETGVLYAVIGVLTRRFAQQKYLILVLLMVIFSILGGITGFSEEALALVPLVLTVCTMMGFDNITALAVVMLGTRCGNTTGLMNPFVMGISQGIAGLPLYSGLGYRIIWYLIILAVTCWFVIRYALRQEKALKLGKTDGTCFSTGGQSVDIPVLTKRHILMLLVMIISFSALLHGVFALDWYMSEISAIFIIMGIACGMIGAMKANSIALAFLKGVQEMTTAGLICGVACTMSVIMNKSQIMDTIIYNSAALLEQLPALAASYGMYVFHFFFAFLVPSCSAHAAITMPFMAPLSDFLGITRQTAVLALHYGSGFSHLCMPTQGTLMAFLAISKVPFDKYIKWVLPLLFLWIIIGGISIAIATWIGLGPF